MFFCEMRSMPRLRDCAAELTVQVVRRAHAVVGAVKDRLARGRVVRIAPAGRSRLLRWARAGS
jgi:hypothetical protein